MRQQHHGLMLAAPGLTAEMLFVAAPLSVLVHGVEVYHHGSEVLRSALAPRRTQSYRAAGPIN